jgi:hypothetical protein
MMSAENDGRFSGRRNSEQEHSDRLHEVIVCKQQQGFKSAGILTELKELPKSYDAVAEQAQKLADLPFRRDWQYREPNDLDDI